MNEQKSYSIKEASEKSGLSEHTLRYYEKIGLIDSVHRMGNGRRYYSEMDLKRISFLKCLRYTEMPIEKMIEFVNFRREGDNNCGHRIKMLESHRQSIIEQMNELENILSMIDWKIDFFQTKAAKNRIKNEA